MNAPRQLFRQEAIDAQREKMLGSVSVARPLPLWVFTLLAAVCAVLLIVFAFWGEYTRRERVDGFLSLTAGAARIQVTEAGTIAELFVREGDAVEAGSPIARLSLERASVSGANTSVLVQEKLKERAGSIDSERDATRRLAAQQQEQLRARIGALVNELAQADAEIKLQGTRVASARDDFQRTDELVQKGFSSAAAMTAKRNDVLEQQVKLQTLKRQRAGIERDLITTRSDVGSIDIKLRQSIDQLGRQQSELQQSLVQEEARRETIIRAPITGTITNIAASRGETLAADAPLAMLLPAGSGLRAQLLVPTRAIGFIQPGNEVVLRYDAFPFQRFGQHRGEVETVSRTVWSAGERIGALTAREPVYRVEVKLDKQTVMAGGQETQLRPGMTVNADILLERRTVFEWIFEPVLELRARL